MPWEHAMLGYIGYSVLLRLGQYGPPTPVETATVVFASVFPDLVDKPLAWQYNFFLSGHAFAHSVFVALPVTAAVFLLARRYNERRIGGAFGIGYLIHLPADVLPTYLRGDGLPIERVLWPVRQNGSGYDDGFKAELFENLASYGGWILEQATSGSPDPYVFVLLGIVGSGLLLWIADGMPIGREFYVALRDVTRERFS